MLWIIAPDCRGHGDAAGSVQEVIIISDYVFDLGCVIQALGVKTISHQPP
jgi:hypothetical protein